MATPPTGLTTFVDLSISTRVTAAWLNAVDGLLFGTAVNVMSSVYGAVGDGSTNDTVAVQAAFDAGVEHVIFPAGYDFSIGEITVPPSVTRITMYGATIRHRAVGSAFGLFSKLTATNLGPLLVEGGTIIGVAADALAVADSGFYFDTATTDIGDTDHLVFRDIHFKTMQGYPIRAGYAKSITIDNCSFENCSIGPNIYTSRPVVVRNCNWSGQQYTGTSVTPALALNANPEPTDDVTDDQQREIHINGCSFRDIKYHQAILLHGAVFGDIGGNTFETCSAPISVHDNGTVGSYIRDNLHSYILLYV